MGEARLASPATQLAIDPQRPKSKETAVICVTFQYLFFFCSLERNNLSKNIQILYFCEGWIVRPFAFAGWCYHISCPSELYFYQTRVRSFPGLVSNWLTDWQTSLFLRLKLDWCDSVEDAKSKVVLFLMLMSFLRKSLESWQLGNKTAFLSLAKDGNRLITAMSQLVYSSLQLFEK